MPTDLSPDRLARLVKLLARCDSDADGEALAALRAARSLLAQDRLCLADLASAWPAARHGVANYDSLVDQLDRLNQQAVELASDLKAERAARETLFAAAVAELEGQERAIVALERRLSTLLRHTAYVYGDDEESITNQPNLPLEDRRRVAHQPLLFDADDPIT